MQHLFVLCVAFRGMILSKRTFRLPAVVPEVDNPQPICEAIKALVALTEFEKEGGEEGKKMAREQALHVGFYFDFLSNGARSKRRDCL